eukprot:Tamp_09792.p2 GENE.Tamp_09792~~Tamp_09792.p2  ORF type:complete len:240 (-),score=46.28 Tamp_09792:1160-1879(-)
MEHVWKLKRPDVIISVTGGAEDFDLSTEELDRIFKAMMDGTRSLDAWFVTGGTNAGVMRCMGEFRAKYNPTAPLIGVASLGVINGSERLRGIDTTNCPKEADKKGWQKFGFTHERLPPLSDEDVVGTRISKLEDEIAYDEHRIKVLKEFERSKKASEKVLTKRERQRREMEREGENGMSEGEKERERIRMREKGEREREREREKGAPGLPWTVHPVMVQPQEVSPTPKSPKHPRPCVFA